MTIRTPDDEIEKVGYYLPPFAEGRNYQGITYPGHSDHSVDFNRRTPAGGWLDDTGDPVYAAADGQVAEVDKANGLVMLNHWGGRYRTEYRHMTGIPVKVGDKVQRGDRVGNIGNVAGDGRSFGAHLHHVHWKRAKTSAPWERTRMTFEGKPIATSVGNSDTQPAGWQPPAAVNVVGPPPRATWESAYREAAKALEKSDEAREGWREKAALLKEERDLATTTVAELRASATILGNRVADLENAHAALVETSKSIIAGLERDLAACKAQTPTDCVAQLAAQRASLLAAVRNGVGALVDGLEAEG